MKFKTYSEAEFKTYYELHGVLGSGGFATVYHAHYRADDPTERKYIALKKGDMRQHQASGQTFLLREVDVAKNANQHANVARYLDYFRVKNDDGTVEEYASMTHYRLGNLRQ